MNELCTDMGLPDGRGRQSELARIFEVTSKAARRWLVGEGFPEIDLAIAIAKWGDVNFEWLMTGRGPKSGHKLPTRALIVDEILRRGTPAERKSLISFVSYTIEHSESPVAKEEKARYLDALSTYVKDAEPPRKQ